MDKSFSYQKHIIAYLDILNFKKIVQDDAYNDLFATLFALINSFAGRDMASMRLKGIKTAVLSDSLIFSIRYSEKAAFHKILNLAEVVQTFLLEKEIITHKRGYIDRRTLSQRQCGIRSGIGGRLSAAGACCCISPLHHRDRDAAGGTEDLRQRCEQSDGDAGYVSGHGRLLGSGPFPKNF